MPNETPSFRSSGANMPMSVDSLIAMIRRHVGLFRENPEFINYVINLALYLIEVNEGEIPIDNIPEPRQGERAKLTATTVGKLEGAVTPPETARCHICGSPTDGKRVCPHCGNMVK